MLVILNDGKEYGISFYGFGYDGSLGMEIIQGNLLEIVTEFSNKDATSTIIFSKPNGVRDPVKEYYSAEWNLRNAVNVPNGNVYISLTKVE